MTSFVEYSKVYFRRGWWHICDRACLFKVSYGVALQQLHTELLQEAESGVVKLF